MRVSPISTPVGGRCRGPRAASHGTSVQAWMRGGLSWPARSSSGQLALEMRAGGQRLLRGGHPGPSHFPGASPAVSRWWRVSVGRRSQSRHPGLRPAEARDEECSHANGCSHVVFKLRFRSGRPSHGEFPSTASSLATASSQLARMIAKRSINNESACPPAVVQSKPRSWNRSSAATSIRDAVRRRCASRRVGGSPTTTGSGSGKIG